MKPSSTTKMSLESKNGGVILRCFQSSVTCTLIIFLITFRSTIVQSFLRQEPSQRHREFTESKMFQLLTAKSDAYPLPSSQYPHIAQAQAPVESELDPGQLRGVRQLNSLQSAVLIHGPPGTGKTFGIAAALKNRVHPPRIPEAPREITVIVTVSNHAAINVAKALVDRNVIGFKLGMSGSAFDIAMNSGNRDLIKLHEAQKVWLPEDIHNQATRDQKRTATKMQKDVLRQLKVIVMTVFPLHCGLY
jgi:hypothetical protein